MDEIFTTLCDELSELSGRALIDVAEDAGVCLDTLYRWRRGEVCYPYNWTIITVAEALGYEIKITKATKPKLKRVA